jgi:hypothetical protein
MGESMPELEAEIDALKAVLTALDPLDDATRRRVIAYVHQRWQLPSDLGSALPEQITPSLLPQGDEEPPPSGEITDIRALKERKQPKSAAEMAVVVAYYLREVAPASGRRATIGTQDIERYFKQADYPLPSAPRNVLTAAKNGGYLDAHTRGQYALNPVGYNLVAHGLPRESGAASKSRGKRRKATSTRGKKSAARKLANRKSAPRSKRTRKKS